MRASALLVAPLLASMSAMAVMTVSATDASASPPLLSPLQLDSGADAIVTARVTDIEMRWTEDRAAIETIVSLELESLERGFVDMTIRIRQPGGEVDGAHHQILGMPSYALGEVAQFHLRRVAGGDYRVFGWSQGKRTLEPGAPSPRFTHNGMRWQPEQIPIAFLVHQDGSDDVGFVEARAAILRAFAAWEDIPCSSLAFVDMGDTDLTPAIDGVQIVTWTESGWIYGEEAAGATSLFFAPGETPTADIALNGEHYSWADGVPTVGPATQDIQGVMTHELGHFVGLGHTDRSIDTMYFSWTPWQSQRSLSADDKLGLCALYPAPAIAHECADDNECDDGAICETFDSGRLCSPQPDPLGADCGRDRVECGDFCLYTALDLSVGYCSRFCDDLDCPPGFECQNASAGGNPVRVCFRAAACDEAAPCPDGRFCGDDGICTFECREDIDCDEGGACLADGKCLAPTADPDSGCGCRAGPASSAAPLALLLLVLLTLPKRRGA